MTLSLLNSQARTVLAIGVLAAAAALGAPAAGAPPHLERRGAATQLIVDGKPWLILGGEVSNTGSTDMAGMDTVWPQLQRLHLNTALVGTAWAWVEPKEGAFDFKWVDQLIEGARAHDLRLVFLWFGSWKNSLSSFAPGWVKADQRRFPRVRIRSGQSVEILTPLSEAARDGDERAYVAFMRHLAQVDGERHTVLMIQMENEVGVLGDSRDRGAEADAAFAGPVPQELLEALGKAQSALLRTPSAAGAPAGAPAAGGSGWEKAFGPGNTADEAFMAWQYGRYMGHIAAAGKAVYPIPVYTNTWIVQPSDRGPGDYPSGGPEPRVLDIWKAAAPAIDFNAPDIYLPDFDVWTGRFHRPDNPLFIPESRGDSAGVANAFFAIGEHAAIGYSPFGIDEAHRLSTQAAAAGAPLPLGRGYAVLGQLASRILQRQSDGGITGAWLNSGHPRQDSTIGGYTIHFELRRDRRDPSKVAQLGCALALAEGPDAFIVAGTDVQVTFSPAPPADGIAGIADAELGTVTDGTWVASRKMSGDDIVLDYDLAAAAQTGQSGSGLRFGPDGPIVQRVLLYRYR